MEAELTIKPGGVLTKKYWHYDEEKEEGEYRFDDVSDRVAYNWYRSCTIEDGVTLRDIFVLIAKNIEAVMPIINNWVEEIVEEGLLPYEPTELKPGDCDIEFLEVYWSFHKDEEGGLSGYSFPDFHGWGAWGDGETKGGIGVSLTPANEIAHHKLVLRKEISVMSDYEVVEKYADSSYALGQILYGIIWELSFHGGPAERKAQGDALSASIARIKSGEEPLFEMKTNPETGELEFIEISHEESIAMAEEMGDD